MRIETLARDAGVRLVWKPSILGPIFALQGWNDSQPGRYAVRREVDEKISAS